MIGISRRTFGQLVTEVLSWMGDEGDTGALKTLVEYAVRNSHEKRLTNQRHPFLLDATLRMFTTVVGQKSYPLHEAFQSALYFRPRLSPDNMLTEIPYSQLQNHLPATGQQKFTLHGISGIKNQPTSATTLGIAGHASGQSLIITGEDASGDVIEETVIHPTAVSALTYTRVTNIRKEGTFTSGTITITAGAVTVLSLPYNIYGRQYRQFNFLLAPTSAGEVVEYEFFRAPRTLLSDNDIPDTPHPFDRIHVLDALLDLQGYTRATAPEIQRWSSELVELEQDLLATHQDGLSLNAEQNYTNYIPR